MNFLHMASSTIIMLFLISLLILVHELGHFLAAKLVGIRVDKFGFGLPFGPTLFSKKIGETEILIHAFLLGGYVSFPDDEEECDLPKDSDKRFTNKTVGQRILVICAGVIFNVILAYILIFSTGLLWKHLPDNKFTIYFEKFAPSAVESIKISGIEKGDKLYSINGLEVEYPMTVTKFFTMSKEYDGFADKKIIDKKLEELKQLNGDKTTFEAGETIKLPQYTDEETLKLTRDNILGLEKYKSTEIALTEEQKELRDDINYNKEYKASKPINIEDIAAAISDTKKPIYIVVERKGDMISLPAIYSDKEGKVGIVQSYSENYTETKTLKQLIPATIHYVNYNVSFMVYSLGKLFTGKIPMSDMNGIIAIAKIGTEIIAYKGIFQGLLLTAMISLNLALINILPIPALDGGHLMFLIIEKITGRSVSKVFIEKLSTFFFYLLIALMVIIIYNDIFAWVTGKI